MMMRGGEGCILLVVNVLSLFGLKWEGGGRFVSGFGMFVMVLFFNLVNYNINNKELIYKLGVMMSFIIRFMRLFWG